MFEIWQDPKTGKAALIADLKADEKVAIRSLGFKKIKTFVTSSKHEAQLMFIAWCKEQSPDAKVEPADVKAKAPEFFGLKDN